jgi:hypothetical protein
MVLWNGNVNSFNADMTWYNNNGTGTHTHEILNFKSNPIDVTVKPGENALVKGLTDVGTNHRISSTNVHSTIDIKGGKTISISLDDKETNKHFAGQTIYGVVNRLLNARTNLVKIWKYCHLAVLPHLHHLGIKYTHFIKI